MGKVVRGRKTQAVLGLLLSPSLPPAPRAFLFGARLVALLKKDGGLRPIACGEILRRVAGRALCMRWRRPLAELLLRAHQVGVAVDAGGETAARLARTVSARWLAEHRSDSCVLKIDFTNAFNEHNRQHMLSEVAAAFPDALWYAVAAYASPTRLVFGDYFLSSSSGVQQGDPLGPALFSIHLAAVWREALQDASLDLHVWYLDDGTICGRRETVRAIFTRLQLNSQGFRVNPAKCEVISSDSAADRVAFPELAQFRPLSDWTLLGVPCGDLKSCDALAVQQIAAASKKTSIIATCPDPHVGYALLRYCGAYGLTVHVARYGGDPSLFRPFDVEVAKAFEQFAVPLPPDSWLQARLPLRRGGLGLRRAADHAAVAAVASAIGTSAQAPALGHLFALEDDPLAARALLNLPVATVSGLSASVDEARRLAGYVPHLQRQFSAIVDEAASSELLASLDQAALARLSSASGKHASGWLACIPPPDGSFADMWLAPQDFLVAVRLRLGLPLDDVPHPCVLCKVVVVWWSVVRRVWGFLVGSPVHFVVCGGVPHNRCWSAVCVKRIFPQKKKKKNMCKCTWKTSKRPKKCQKRPQSTRFVSKITFGQKFFFSSLGGFGPRVL